jgi:hypothetical protein
MKYILILLFSLNAFADTDRFHYEDTVRLTTTINLSKVARFYNCDKIEKFEVVKLDAFNGKYLIVRHPNTFDTKCNPNDVDVWVNSSDIEKVN